MVTAAAERHIFSPQNCIVEALNTQFLGLYEISDLPSYYHPPQDALDFVDGLIDMIVSGDVELVLNDEAPGEEHVGLVEQQRVSGGVYMIIGPKRLEEKLGGYDRSDPKSWLWDQGTVDTVLKRNCIVEV